MNIYIKNKHFSHRDGKQVAWIRNREITSLPAYVSPFIVNLRPTILVAYNNEMTTHGETTDVMKQQVVPGSGVPRRGRGGKRVRPQTL